MKTKHLFITAIVGGLILGGCTANADGTPTERVVTETPEPAVTEVVDISTPAPAPKKTKTAEPVISKEEVFLIYMKGAFPYEMAQLDDDLVVETARNVCKAWEGGATFEDVGMIVLTSGLDVEFGGALIGGGTEAFCPEYGYIIDNL